MNPRTPLEGLLAGLYDAQVAEFGDTSRAYRWLRLSERGAVLAMWRAVAGGTRDPGTVADVAGVHLRSWSRSWDPEAWAEFHKARLEAFSERLIAAHDTRTEVAA